LFTASPSSITQTTNGSRYENAFFGLSVEKPKGWNSQSPMQLLEIMQAVADSTSLLGNKNEFRQELLDNAMAKALPLFGFFKYPPGTLNGKLNPNILAIAENLKSHPEVKTACDYLILSRELIKSVNFTSECHETDFNGEMFATQSFTLKIPGVPIVKQTHYAKMSKKGYILFFSLTYFNRASKNKLENVMRSLKFSQS
jgi:hypothetical protein